MNTPYTYTILRYVHDTMTGEFVNVGVALFAPERKYAGALCRTTYGRLANTFPGMDGEAFKRMMRFIQSRFEEIGERLHSELPLDAIPQTVLEFAHQVLPADDSSLQWSPMGSGLTADASRTLEGLYDRMVQTYDERKPRETRSDDDVWREYKRELEARQVLKYLKPKKIAVQDDEIEFSYAWKNGLWHCLEPISLDLSQAGSIREKAHRWLGQIMSVKDAPEEFKVYLLLGEPQDRKLRIDYENAVSILKKIPAPAQIVSEVDAPAFSRWFAGEIAEHEKPE